jgi:hypothetical protein
VECYIFRKILRVSLLIVARGCAGSRAGVIGLGAALHALRKLKIAFPLSARGVPKLFVIIYQKDIK